MYRKTRTDFKDNAKNNGAQNNCVGTDINRNFGFKWGGQGAAINKCADTYRGPYAFSEPEAAALADFLIARRGTWAVSTEFIK